MAYAHQIARETPTQREKRLSRKAEYRNTNREKIRSSERTESSKERARQRRINRWAERLLDDACRHSTKRGHEAPTISVEWIMAQPMVCPYLGIELSPSDSNAKPSLDRIDNTRGYHPDNVRLTSWMWNKARGAISVTDAPLIARGLLVLAMENTKPASR